MLEHINHRVANLNKWINNSVVDGKRVHYDRTRVLSSDHTQIELGQDGATVTIPSIDLLKKEFSNSSNEESVGGTCRELAQWAMVNLLKDNVVDSAEVYACASDKEAHYVVVAEIDGEKYLVDLGYSQPVLEAIRVDGLDYISKDYAGEQGSKQAFSGEITYNAVEEKDGTILFTIDSESRSTEFILNPLTEELDAQIPGKWAAATGSGYATLVSKNTDGTYQVNAGPMGDEAVLEAEFKKLHEMIAQRCGDAIRVVFRKE